MIDSQSEHIITLSQAANELPRRQRGRKTHVSTLYRWVWDRSPKWSQFRSTGRQRAWWLDRA
jgi:hypothetical protein